MQPHRHRRPLSWDKMCVRLAADDTWTTAHRDLVYRPEPVDQPADLAKIDEVRWLYAYGFHNGPLSGMVTTPQGRLWAEAFIECGLVGDDACGFYRQYLLFGLDDVAMKAELDRHELFQTFVGFHMDYYEDGTRRAGQLQPYEEWPFYYRRQLGPPELSTARLVGYCER